jgi:hypothetical protein
MASTAAARADDIAIAEKLFLEGRKLMDEGKYESACQKFEAAHGLDKMATGTLLNLALCHEQIKRNATAWAEFRQVVAESLGRREDRVTMARTHEAKLAPLLSYVVIDVSAPARVSGMRIDMDRNRPIPEASWGVELPIDPGKHVFEVSAPGKTSRTIEVDVGEVGDRKKVEVPTLANAPTDAGPAPGTRPSTESSSSTQRTVGYVLGGVGIAALSAGAIFGGLAMSRNEDADDAARACPNDRCPTEAARSRAVDAIDDATTYANVANVTVGAGLAMIVGGIILVVTAKPDTAASALDKTHSSTSAIGKTRSSASALPAMFRMAGRAGGATFSLGGSW